MTKPMKHTAIDMSRITYNVKSRKLPSGESKQVQMGYDKNELVMYIPKTKVPFGLTQDKISLEDSTKMKKFSLDCNIEGSPDIESFRTFLEKLDTNNIEKLVDKSVELWKVKKSVQGITEGCYNACVKQDPDKKYPPRFKIKLPFYNGVPQFKVYDTANKEIVWYNKSEKKDPELDWSWTSKGMQVEAVCGCEGMWVVNQSVYCTFKAMQLRVSAADGLNECAFDEPVSVVSNSVVSVPETIDETDEDYEQVDKNQSVEKVEDSDSEAED
jgi:hypothetical protein